LYLKEAVVTNINRRSMMTLAAGAVLGAPWVAGEPLGETGEECMSKQNADVVAKYVAAWERRDLTDITALIHPEIQFKSPTASLNGRDKYVEATARFLPMLERVELRAQFVSDDGAMLAWDFVCRPPIGACPTAELVRIKGGLIYVSEVFFDARSFEAFAKAQAARKDAK
jgi:hypothetical protein